MTLNTRNFKKGNGKREDRLSERSNIINSQKRFMWWEWARHWSEKVKLIFDISPSSFLSPIILGKDVLKVPLMIEVVGDDCCDNCCYWTLIWLYYVPTAVAGSHLCPIVSPSLSHSILLPSTLCFCGHAGFSSHDYSRRNSSLQSSALYSRWHFVLFCRRVRDKTYVVQGMPIKTQ